MGVAGRRVSAYGAVACIACASVARAGEFNYGADLGIGYTDNINQSINKVSEEIAEEGVQFSGLEQSSRLQAEVVGDLEHLNFLQGTNSPEVIGNLSGFAGLTLIPEYLKWTLQDYFGQGVTDPFAPPSPGNREDINSVSTGPTLTLPLNTHEFLTLNGGYTLVTYQTSPLSSNQFNGGFSFTELLSQLSRVSFNVDDRRYDFQNDTLNPDYDQRDVYVRYQATGARTRLIADLGYDQIRGDQSYNAGGFLGRLTVIRTLAAQSTLTVTAGREFSSSSSFVSQSQTVSGIGLQTTPGQQTSTPFTNQYVTGTWTFTRPRTTFSVLLAHYQQTYEGDEALDQTLTSGGVHVTRILFPAWSAGLSADYSKQTLAAETGGNYRQVDGGVDVKWQLGRKFSLALQYQYYKRNGGLDLYNVSENRVFLRLQYGSAALRSSLIQGGLTPGDSTLAAPFDPTQMQVPTPTPVAPLTVPPAPPLNVPAPSPQ
jgi:hypothetical protein